MAKASIVVIEKTSIILELTEVEANWLQARLQNPIDVDSRIEAESKVDQENRSTIYWALDEREEKANG